MDYLGFHHFEHPCRDDKSDVREGERWKGFVDLQNNLQKLQPFPDWEVVSRLLDSSLDSLDSWIRFKRLLEPGATARSLLARRQSADFHHTPMSCLGI